MAKQVTFLGSNIKDAHTHYEVATSVGRLIIPGYIFDDFKREYKGSLREYSITATIDFIPNGQRVDTDPFLRADALVGTLHSLEEIVEAKKWNTILN